MERTAIQWKTLAQREARAKAIELELPSGMVILARRPDPGTIAMWGGLPGSLTSPRQAPDAESLTMRDVEETARFMRETLLFCVIEPAISLAPEEGQIHPRDIPWQDCQFILHWAMRVEEARDLKPFRGERSHVGSGADGQGVLDEAF